MYEIMTVLIDCGKCNYYTELPDPAWPDGGKIGYCTYKAHMDYAHMKPKPKPASWFNENGCCPYNTARKSE